jgi:hypothetical protein
MWGDLGARASLARLCHHSVVDYCESEGVAQMAKIRFQGQPSEEQKRHARKKENNPFSEQEKHGEEAQHSVPQSPTAAQNNASVQPQASDVKAAPGKNPTRKKRA